MLFLTRRPLSLVGGIMTRLPSVFFAAVGTMAVVALVGRRGAAVEEVTGGSLIASHGGAFAQCPAQEY